jgi:hypothetical protein
MYNSDIPTRAELPTTRQLIRSTIMAFVAAVVILVTIVLPAEYAIDPTGIGRALKLTEMGEIKTQLHAEAEADKLRDQAAPAPDKQSSLIQRIVSEFLISPAHAQTATTPRKDVTTITLKPTEGVEYKLAMKKDATVNFSWTAKDGVVNYDMHGTPASGGKEKSYKAGRGSAGETGVLTAESDGMHGWFWRNRGKSDVTITLITEGAYSEIKRMN